MERMWQNVCETVPKSVYRVKQPSRSHRLAAYQNGIWRNKRPPSSTHSSTALSLEFPLANEKLTLYLTIFVIDREPLRGITMDFNNVLLTFTTRIKAPLLSCDMFYDLPKPSPSVSEKHSSGEHTVLFILLRSARILFPFISTFSQWRLQCWQKNPPKTMYCSF